MDGKVVFLTRIRATASSGDLLCVVYNNFCSLHRLYVLLLAPRTHSNSLGIMNRDEHVEKGFSAAHGAKANTPPPTLPAHFIRLCFCFSFAFPLTVSRDTSPTNEQKTLKV